MSPANEGGLSRPGPGRGWGGAVPESVGFFVRAVAPTTREWRRAMAAGAAWRRCPHMVTLPAGRRRGDGAAVLPVGCPQASRDGSAHISNAAQMSP